MHLFIPIVAAGITLYLLRNWWERLQYRREMRRVERVPQPSMEWPTGLITGGIVATLLVVIIAVATHH